MKINYFVIPLVIWTMLFGNMDVVAQTTSEFSAIGEEGGKLLADCPPVANTPNFTIAYGAVVKNGQSAPVGSVVLAKSPRGDTVGCAEIASAGYYGAMYIYGEDTSVTPNIPGMRVGETVSFSVDNVSAIASPNLSFANDRNFHEINLTATGESAPLADFTANPTSGNASLNVTFNNLTVGAVTSWLWTFGDGATSTQQSPTHIYTSKGVYTVSLQAINGAGSSTKTRTDYINVYNAAVANFSATPTNGIAPLQVNFTNTSTGDYSSTTWAFGDGGTSAEPNPSHTYINPGTYTVSLSISGLGGLDTETKTELITVYQPVNADFSASPTTGIAPLKVNFTNLSTGTFSAVSWSFGDGGTSAENNPSHTYSQPGTYAVSITVSGNGGEDTETKVDFVSVYYGVFLPLIVR